MDKQLVRSKAQLAREKMRRLREQSKQKSERQLSGLWKFRVNVKRLVSEGGKVERCNWIVDYHIHLKIENGRVSGTMFGANEVSTDNKGGYTTSYARISGTCDERGRIQFVFQFKPKYGKPGSERFKGTLQRGRIVGQLSTGQIMPGHRNYEGPVECRKLTSYDLDKG